MEDVKWLNKDESIFYCFIQVLFDILSPISLQVKTLQPTAVTPLCVSLKEMKNIFLEIRKIKWKILIRLR